MEEITQDQLAKFASLVAKCWNDESLHRGYRADPVKILAQHGIKLPDGVPAPVIPSRPEVGPATGLMAVPAAFSSLNFDNWDLTIQELQEDAAIKQPRLSSLACFACPVSCFSSLSR